MQRVLANTQQPLQQELLLQSHAVGAGRSAFSFLNSDKASSSKSSNSNSNSPSTTLSSSGSSSTCSNSSRGPSQVVVFDSAATPYKIIFDDTSTAAVAAAATPAAAAAAAGNGLTSRRTNSADCPAASEAAAAAAENSVSPSFAAAAESLRVSFAAAAAAAAAADVIDAAEVLGAETQRQNLQEIERAQHISAVVNVTAGLQQLQQQQQNAGLFAAFTTRSGSVAAADSSSSSSSFMPLLLLGGEQQQQQQRIHAADFEPFFSSLAEELTRFERSTIISSRSSSSSGFEHAGGRGNPVVDLLLGVGPQLPKEQQQEQQRQKELLQQQQKLLLQQLLQEMPSVFFSASFDVSHLLAMDSQQLPKQLEKLSDWLDKVESGLVSLFPPFSFFESSIQNIHHMQQQTEKLVSSCHQLREELLQIRSRSVELGLRVLSLSKKRQRLCVLYRQLESLQSLGALCSSVPLLLQLRDWRTAALLLHSAEQLMTGDLLKLTAVQQLKAQADEEQQRLKAASQSAFVSESIHFFFSPVQQDGPLAADADAVAAGCLLSRTLTTTTPCLHPPEAAAATSIAAAATAANGDSWYFTQCTLLPGILDGRALYHPTSHRWLLLLPPAAAAAATATTAATAAPGAATAAATADIGSKAAAAASQQETDTWTPVSSAFAAALLSQVARQVYGRFAEGWAAACRLDEEPQDEQQQQQQQQGFAWEARICGEIGEDSSLSAALEVLLSMGLLQKSLLQLRQQLPAVCRDSMRRTIIMLLSERGVLQQQQQQQQLGKGQQQQVDSTATGGSVHSPALASRSSPAAPPEPAAAAAAAAPGTAVKPAAAADMSVQLTDRDLNNARGASSEHDDSDAMGQHQQMQQQQKQQQPDQQQEGQQQMPQQKRVRAAQLSAALAALRHSEFCCLFRDVCGHVLSVACRVESWVSFVLLRASEFGTYRLARQQEQQAQQQQQQKEQHEHQEQEEDEESKEQHQQGDELLALVSQADSLTREWRVVAAALVRVAEICLDTLMAKLASILHARGSKGFASCPKQFAELLLTAISALGCLYTVQQRLRTRVAQILLQSLNVTVVLLQQHEQQQGQQKPLVPANGSSKSSSTPAAPDAAAWRQPVFFGDCSGSNSNLRLLPCCSASDACSRLKNLRVDFASPASASLSPHLQSHSRGILEASHEAKILQLDVLLGKETWERQPLQQNLSGPLAEILLFAAPCTFPDESEAAAAAATVSPAAAAPLPQAAAEAVAAPVAHASTGAEASACSQLQEQRKALQGTADTPVVSVSAADTAAAAASECQPARGPVYVGPRSVFLEGEEFAVAPSALVTLALVQEYISLAAWLPFLQSSVFSSLANFLLHFARVSVHLTVEGGAVQRGRLQRITAGVLARVARSFDCLLFFADRLAANVGRQQRQQQHLQQHQQTPQQQHSGTEEEWKPPQRPPLLVLPPIDIEEQQRMYGEAAEEQQQQQWGVEEAAAAFLRSVRRPQQQRSPAAFASDPAAAAAAAAAEGDSSDAASSFIPPFAPPQAVRVVSRQLGLVSSGLQSGHVLQRLQQAINSIAHSKSLVFEKLVEILVDRFECHATLWVSAPHPPAAPATAEGNSSSSQPQKPELPLPHEALRELVKDISSMHRVLVRVLPQESVGRLFALAFHSMAEVFVTKLQRQQQQQQQRQQLHDGGGSATVFPAGGASGGADAAAGELGVSFDAAGAAAAGRQWSIGDRFCVDCLCLSESLKGLTSLNKSLCLWVRDLANACSKVSSPSEDIQQLFDAAVPQ